MVGFDTSLNGARVSVTRKTSGCCLCHCVLPSVFQSGFPLSCAQASIPVFGEFVWALPLKKKKKGNWIPLLIFDPCSNLSHHPTIGPRVMGALFMRERAGQSQLTGQGQALMKPWDQVVAASASFTGHWAWMSKGSRAPFREKQRGGGYAEAPSAIAVLHKHPQPCTWPSLWKDGAVYGKDALPNLL